MFSAFLKTSLFCYFRNNPPALNLLYYQLYSATEKHTESSTANPCLELFIYLQHLQKLSRVINVQLCISNQKVFCLLFGGRGLLQSQGAAEDVGALLEAALPDTGFGSILLARALIRLKPLFVLVWRFHPV